MQSEDSRVLTENKNSSAQHKTILLTELLKGKINYVNHLFTQVEKIISVGQLGKVDLNAFENLPIVIKWLLIKTSEKWRQLSVRILQSLTKISNIIYIRWSSYNPKVLLNLGCSSIFNNTLLKLLFN